MISTREEKEKLVLDLYNEGVHEYIWTVTLIRDDIGAKEVPITR